MSIPSIFPPSREARLIGLKGEIAFVKHCEEKGLKSRLTRNRMQRWDVTVQGKKVDVKTMRTAFHVNGEYNVDLSSAQASLDSDVYAFVFYNEREKKFTVAGALPREDYLKKAVLKREGEKERGGNFTYACDTFVVKVSDLLPIEKIVKCRVIP